MNFETLLIPTDGSEPAANAARQGFALADALDTSVHILSVADSSIATGTGYSGDSPRIRKRLREKASKRAASLCDEAAERGLDATAVTREGIPAKEIIDYASENEVDAIVIGTSGRSGLARAVIGSVADKVVRTASVPVVTVTPRAAEKAASEKQFDSVLLPTDGSEQAEQAAIWGIALANQLGATVHLISVVDRAKTGGLESLFDGEDAEELLERAAEHLSSINDEARDRNIDVVTVTTEGSPAKEIVAYADDEDIDVIAMGTAGRGGFKRAVLGSVTDEVIRKANVPVLTSRPEAKRFE